MIEMQELPTRWAGEWISPAEAEHPGADRPAYLLEHDFELPGTCVSAHLYATALGVYEAIINGRRVGDHELAPGSTSYDRTLYAQIHDVANHLKPGRNSIQIVLSDGWYRGRNGSTQDQNCWGDFTAALVQLDVRHSDGSSTVIGSDATWTSRPSQIIRADLMRGQTTDFSRAESACEPVRVGLVTNAPSPSLSPAPPVRRVQQLPVVEMISESAEVSIADFGQNFSGWVRLSDLGETGDETTLEFGEHLDPGNRFTTEHLDTHTPRGEHVVFQQLDRVIAGGGESVFEPRHTVHGFRYVRITHPGRSIAARDITGVVVHSDFATTGQFESSDEAINRLHEAGRWTFRANAVDVPTDCPTRERVGWTGDFQIFAPVAAMLFDIDGFARKWLQSVRDDQYDDGCLAMFSPDPLRMRVTQPADRIGGGSAGWGDAAIAVPWTLYRHYGDPHVLEESWESACAWVDYALGCARTFRHPSRIERSEVPLSHEQFIWDGPFHFGEWLEPRARTTTERDPAGALEALFAEDQGEVGTAYLFRSLSQLAQAATILGKATDAERLNRLAEQVRAAWGTEFLKAEGLTAKDTQAAYVRAIGFGLIPDRLKDAAAARLAELVELNDEHLSTGFLTTGMLLPVLADAGYDELAYRLLLRHGSPSWVEMLNRGATTFWENWENVDDAGRVYDGSLNHYSKGAVVGYLYSHLAGIRQEEGSAGWQRIRIQPMWGGSLSRASARMRTPSGEVLVSWQREGDAIELSAVIPNGVHAELHLPGRPPERLPAGPTTVHTIVSRR